jgi:DNA invertase Pin-like site-specific DNA recombinase
VSRAKDDLKSFAQKLGMKITAWYIENELRVNLQCPELFKLLPNTPGDILLLEQVDRLSLLNAEDWGKLKAELSARRARVVALDLPTS